MKLNFKEWNIVYDALNEKAEKLKGELKWYEDYDKEHKEESESSKTTKAQLAAVNAIIKKLETAAI